MKRIIGRFAERGVLFFAVHAEFRTNQSWESLHHHCWGMESRYDKFRSICNIVSKGGPLSDNRLIIRVLLSSLLLMGTGLMVINLVTWKINFQNYGHYRYHSPVTSLQDSLMASNCRIKFYFQFPTDGPGESSLPCRVHFHIYWSWCSTSAYSNWNGSRRDPTAR